MSRNERGASAVEFAIVLPVLFLVIAAIVDFGRMFFVQIQLANAAREGARVASIGTLTSTQIQDRAKLSIPSGGGIDAADISFPTLVTCPDASGNTTVTIQANFKWLLMGPAIRMVKGSWAGAASSLQSTAVMKCGG